MSTRDSNMRLSVHQIVVTSSQQRLSMFGLKFIRGCQCFDARL